MIRLSLHPHAATPTTAVRGVDVVLQNGADGALRMDFVLDADAASIVIPPAGPGGFSDGLWRHTCFELFAAGAGDAYREFNFAPSTRYAIYDFAHYRDGMRVADALPPPSIEVARGGLAMLVLLPARLLALDRRSAMRFGIAAVVEERGGALTYWAAHHPRIEPDFHDRNGFIVSLPADAACEER